MEDDGSRKCQLKRYADTEQSQPKRLCGLQLIRSWAWGCRSCLELTLHYNMPDAGQGPAGLNVCPAGFGPCFGPLSVYFPIPPFGMGISTLCHFLLEVSNFFLLYHILATKSLPFSQSLVLPISLRFLCLIEMQIMNKQHATLLAVLMLPDDAR